MSRLFDKPVRFHIPNELFEISLHRWQRQFHQPGASSHERRAPSASAAWRSGASPPPRSPRPRINARSGPDQRRPDESAAARSGTAGPYRVGCLHRAHYPRPTSNFLQLGIADKRSEIGGPLRVIGRSLPSSPRFDCRAKCTAAAVRPADRRPWHFSSAAATLAAGSNGVAIYGDNKKVMRAAPPCSPHPSA